MKSYGCTLDCFGCCKLEDIDTMAVAYISKDTSQKYNLQTDDIVTLTSGCGEIVEIKSNLL